MRNNYYPKFKFTLALKFIACIIILPSLWNSAGTSLFAQTSLCLNIVSGGGNSEAHGMVVTADSGYVMAGQTQGIGGGGYDVYVVKLNKAGVRQWTQTIGGKGDDEAHSITQTYDGGFAVAGWTNSFDQPTRGYDFYVVKLDANGNVLWTRTIGKNGTDEAWAIVQTSDSGLAIAGQTTSFGGNNAMYLVKLDRNGNFLWDRIVTTGGIATQAYGLCQSPDGGYVMCGTTYTYLGAGDPDNSNDFIIVKIAADGTTLDWSTVVRDPTPYNANTGFIGNDYARSVINTSDGGFMIVGESEQPHSTGGKDWHYLAVKLDGSGDITWTRYYGGLNIPGVSIDNSDYPRSVVQTPDSGYVIGGWSFSFNYDFSRMVSTGTDLFIVKCNSSGVFQWSQVIGTDIDDDGEALVQNPDGTYAMAGYNYNTGNDENIYFIKTDTTVSACCTRTIGGDRGTGGTAASAGSSAAAGGTMFLDSGIYSLGGEVFDLGVCGSIAPPPVAQFESSDTTFCSGNCIQFTDLGSNATSWRWSFPGGTPATSNAENPVVCYLTDGNYAVTFTALNINDSDSVYVSNFIHVLVVPPTPDITQTNDTLFCSFDSSYISYQWYDSSAAIPGATNSYYVPTNAGNYNVQVENGNGCSIAVGINLILGIQPFTVNDLEFTVSPNPAGNEIRISLFRAEGIDKMDIYDVLGKKIYSQQSEIVNRKSEILIDISSLSPGIYFVSLSNQGGRQVAKFVKE